jgi:hypothetical protein
VYRTIEDLEKITASAKDSKVGAVIGGGLLGLEAANALNLPYSPTPPRRPFRGLDGRQPPRQLA